MRTKLTISAARVVAPAFALGAVALLLAPVRDAFGFTTLGTILSVNTERDWRIFNDFSDPSANDNGVAHPNYPGWFGAEMALWKAASEWASLPHGDGTGDPSQNLGDGGANFDFVFAGRAASAGNLNKIFATVNNCGGGTFAYVTNGGNAWRGRFCEEWTWSDGPGSPTGAQIDLQGVGTHEFGHSLGLGHTNVAGSSMIGSTADGFDQRDIGPDDMAGVQSIYGALAGSKLTITAASVDTGAGTITLTGTNFAATNNQVWFTNINATTPGTDGKVVVSGVSSSGGGTQITVALPANAADGDVHVKATGTAHSTLSNGWPVDLGNPAGGGPLQVSGLAPATVEALIPGTGETVTITGSGFTSGATVAIDLIPLPAASFTVVDSSNITFDMPQVATLGFHTVSVQVGGQIGFTTVNVVAPTGLVLQVGNGDPLNVVSGNFNVSISGTPGILHFVLYSSSNLPSVFLPYAQLEIGNFFSDLFELNRWVVNPNAVTTTNLPLPPITAVFFFQSMSLAFGLPVVDSNVQSVQIVP